MNEKILCYLTEDANKALHALMECGIDQDLALPLLERLWPESAIYDIPAREDAS